MNNTTHKQRFNYALTFDERIDAANLVGHLNCYSYYRDHLVSAADLQSNNRVVGYAYRRRRVAASPQSAMKPSFWKDSLAELMRQLKLFI